MIRHLPLLAALVLFACRPGADTPDAAPTAEPLDGSAEAVEETSAPTEAPASGSGVDEAPAELDVAAAPDLADEFAPPSLPSLMRQAGFERASEADLADFVHVPPGAEGEAGVFGEGDRAVRVALIAYPNPRYVRPHVTDVLERIRVLPNPREAVLYHHRWVVHLMAVDRATADETAARLLGVLRW